MGAEITPLAAVEVFVGPQKVGVHNISSGGVALTFESDAPYTRGEVLDVSISIRERAFPIQLEVKSVRKRRLSCAFVSFPPAFESSLQEFLQPKYLGESIVRHPALSDQPGAVDLVERAAHHNAYFGQNQTGFFVWTDELSHLLKIVGVSRDLVCEWSYEEGLKTGHFPYKAAQEEEIVWDREGVPTVLHYFADVLLAWLKPVDGPLIVEQIVNSPHGSAKIRFPEI